MTEHDAPADAPAHRYNAALAAQIEARWQLALRCPDCEWRTV